MEGTLGHTPSSLQPLDERDALGERVKRTVHPRGDHQQADRPVKDTEPDVPSNDLQSVRGSRSLVKALQASKGARRVRIRGTEKVTD